MTVHWQQEASKNGAKGARDEGSSTPDRDVFGQRVVPHPNSMARRCCAPIQWPETRTVSPAKGTELLPFSACPLCDAVLPLRCGSVCVAAALLGRFLPKLGPLASVGGPFLILSGFFFEIKITSDLPRVDL